MSKADAPITELRLTISGADSVLGRGEHVVGRSTECSVRIDDPLTSRRHAILVVSPSGVVVRDLGSRNGVLVNGDEIEHERALAEGDVVTVGSQAFTVRQIRRLGDARSATPQAAPPFLARPAPLARISVQRRAPADEGAGARDRPLDARASAHTTLSPDSALSRPAGTFRLIAEAAARAIASGHADRAEQILKVPLLDVLAAQRGGASPEPEIVELALQQALGLCESCEGRRRLRWIDYVHDLHEARGIPIPLDVADRLARAMQSDESDRRDE